MIICEYFYYVPFLLINPIIFAKCLMHYNYNNNESCCRIPVDSLKNANNTTSNNMDNMSTTDDTINSNSAWQQKTQTGKYTIH